MAEVLPQQFLTAEEVADFLRVKKTTVQRWCREGQMTHTQVGKRYLIDRTDLEKWLKKRTKREAWRQQGGKDGSPDQ